MAHAMDYQVGPLRLPGPALFILPLLLAVTGVLGDLFESIIKRSIAVKDSGQLIKGMGGVLDVMDSLLPAAPVLYCAFLLL